MSEAALPRSLPVLDAAASAVAGRDSLPFADRVHRRFFTAGILVALTAGAAWGSALLLRIAAAQSFTKVSIFEVNAHAQAQIYGWVGLFVMGFAYQAFPRFRKTTLPWPRAAKASFLLMVAGIAVRAVAEPLHEIPAAGAVAVAAALVQAGAVALFAAQVAAILSLGRAPRSASDLYLGAAAFWFAASAVLDVWHLSRLLAAPDREALLRQVANWQFALRDLQIHGLAMLMVLGVSLRLLPAVFGLPRPSERLASGLWLPLNLAIAGEAIGFVAFMETRSAAAAAVMGGSILVLAVCGTLAALNLRAFGRPARADRSVKFLRASHVWLIVSLAMLAAAPLWFRVAGVKFSHAWYGSMRHAITVGFLSLAIMGVAAKIVPTLAGLRTSSPSSLWIPFLLVNAGCLLRVTMQAATDFTPLTFPVAGVSGLLEVTGLALWGAPLVRIMLASRRVASFVTTDPGLGTRTERGESNHEL